MEKHKSHTSNQASASNNSAEVFVLPPELLAKLGINLSNIQHSDIVPPTTSPVKDTVQSIDHSIPNCLPDNEDASSIIQTANLMKESVFLSPTFFQTTPTVVSDEGPVVIDESVKSVVNTNTQNSSECGILSHQSNINSATLTKIDSVGEQSTPQLLNDSIVIESNTGILLEEVNNTKDYESVKEYQVENRDGDLILTDVYQNDDNNKIPNEKWDATITVDEHPDEAYLSDCSNSYSGCSPKSVHSDVNKQNMLHKNNSKEKSHVTATDSVQLNNIEDMDVICSSSDAIFTPITINSTIHKSCNDSASTDKQSAAISMIENVIIEPVGDARNFETLQNIPLDNIVSSMPVKQHEKEIEVTTINFIDHKASLVDDSLNENNESDETSNLHVDSDDTSHNAGKHNPENSLQENPELLLIANKLDSEVPSQENAKFIAIADVNQAIEIDNDDKTTIRNTEYSNSNNHSINSNNATDINTNAKKKKKISATESNYSINSNNATDINTNAKKKKKISATESVTNNQDKVKEIAAYLSQIAKERKNRKIEKEAKRDPITSKLCIQGVEKPGGKPIEKVELECTPVSKTYERAIIRKQLPRQIEISDAVATSDSFQITDNYHDTPIDGAKVRALTYQNEFCICFDFGNLAYYDCEMLYEHIHFWSHKNIKYDSETLYSIYHENTTVFKQSVDLIKDTQQNENDGNTSIQNTLCWNEMNVPKINDEKYELATSKSRVSDEASSSNGQKIKTNAILSVVNDQAKDLEVKNVICGVCNQIVADREWKVHKEKEHNSVAWEADQKLDLKNQHLLQTLKQMLKELGFLKCPICKTDFNKMPKYTRHLKKCTQQKMHSGLAPESSTSAKSFQKTRKKTTNLEIKSSNTGLTIKSKKDDKNTSAISKTLVASKVTSKLSEKSVEPAVDISTKSTRNASKLKNVVSSPSTNTPLTSKKQSKTIQDGVEPSRPKRNTSLNSVLKTASNLPTTPIETDTPKGEKTVSASADVTTNDTNIETPKTTRRESKSKNDSSDSMQKSTENKLSKLAKSKDSNDQVYTSKVSKITYIKTYTKSACTVSDGTTKTAPHATKITNNTHQETNTGATKSTKRSSSSTSVHSPIKKVKTIESSNIIEIFAEDSSKKHQTERKTTHSKLIKIEKQSESAELASPAPTVVPCKVEVVDSAAQDKTIEITVVNSTLPDESIDITIEDSTIVYDSVNMTAEESTIPDNSVSAATERSILSSDTAVNNSQSTEYYMVLEPISDGLAKCGVCKKKVEESKWFKHLSQAHNYIAWRDGEPPLNLENKIEIRKHVQSIANKYKGLTCSKCGIVRKFAKPFLRHIEDCMGPKKVIDTSQDTEEYIPLINTKARKRREKPVAAPPFTCGVCRATVEQSAWTEHIRLVHQYLAWTTDEQPLNLNNAAEVKQHLKYISKYHGGLICNTCGVRWSYVKKYQDHVRECDMVGSSKIITRDDEKEAKLALPPIVTCGVCKLDVEGKHWIKHIKVAHQYMAWIGGEQPLNPDDGPQIERHLNMILEATGELVCMKCGESRKFLRFYLQHIAACAKTGFQAEIEEPVKRETGEFVCGVCHESGKLSDWSSHAMSKHYNIAWKVGDIPINLRNPYAVEKYLKQYRKKYGLVCRHCKNSRSSCYGFYAHILTCGRSEEELEAVHDICELCNNKYLCIYRNQHMAAHRDSDMRREKRELLARQAEEEALNPSEPVNPEPLGKRKAAEKAKKVIQKHSSNTVDGVPVCGCGTTFKDAEEFSQHSCPQMQKKDDDDSDVSVKMENESGESGDESVDSGVSDEEFEERKKKRVRVGEGSTKVQRMPYRVNNYPAYLSQAYKDFVRLHYTSERIFNEWRDSEYTVVPADEMNKYLPQVTESCKVRFGSSSSDEWTTYKIFEAKKMRGYSMYTGGASQCIAWAPPCAADDTLGHYLAVSAHRGPDVPRCGAADRPHYPASLQIWEFGQFDIVPRCALCLAHEYGIVWAMDWCPSGARDPAASSPGEPATARLGLLAIACSNGSAYILAVPCPPSLDQHETVMYKLKPVAELRLTMTTERRIYQATAIKWSQQKGHSTIIVGYSDGTTALYDLSIESPILMAKEKGVTIFYPYQDRRSECSSVTGVGVCVTANESYPIGGQFSTSITGGTLCGGASVRPSARVHLAVGGAVHAAHWPAVTLSGDVPFMRSVSEMEWWGGGRRVGAARAWATCARCGRAASAAPPALRAHRHHPAYPEIKKLIVAMLLMVPIGQKMKRKVNDDLSVVVEPLTYEDAAAKYGLQLTFVTKSSRNEQSLAQQICNKNEFRPERFPLSDIVALAFCPSGRFHDRIALATHTGLIFVVNI